MPSANDFNCLKDLPEGIPEILAGPLTLTATKKSAKKGGDDEDDAVPEEEDERPKKRQRRN